MVENKEKENGKVTLETADELDPAKPNGNGFSFSGEKYAEIIVMMFTARKATSKDWAKSEIVRMTSLAFGEKDPGNPHKMV